MEEREKRRTLREAQIEKEQSRGTHPSIGDAEDVNEFYAQNVATCSFPVQNIFALSSVFH